VKLRAHSLLSGDFQLSHILAGAMKPPPAIAMAQRSSLAHLLIAVTFRIINGSTSCSHVYFTNELSLLSRFPAPLKIIFHFYLYILLFTLYQSKLL